MGYASTIYHGLRMGLKFPGMIIRWKLQYRTAKKRFKNELIKFGLPPEEAKELA